MARNLLLAAGVVAATLISASTQAQEQPPEVQRKAEQLRRAQIQAIRAAQIRQRLQPGNNFRGFQVFGSDGETEAVDGFSFREDRETQSTLRKAGELLDQERFAEATEALGRILDDGEDHFVKPAEGSAVFRSAKTEARRALADMPAAGRDSYELQFGAQARQQLDGAVANGDIEAVAEVARRFFHTRAGYEAAFLLGMNHADQGRPLAAVHVWQQLREAGERGVNDFEPLLSILTAQALARSGRGEDGEKLLIDAKKQYGRAPLALGGQARAWFDRDEEAAAWLKNMMGGSPTVLRGVTDWTMFRGGPSRTEEGLGGIPLLAYRWRVPTANDDPAVERAAARMQRSYVDERITALPSLHPLAVGDIVLMRTARNLLAVDFRTGKRLWEVPSENPFEALPSGTAGGLGQDAQGVLEQLEHRLWDDTVYGTLSSDGRWVFAVEPTDVNSGVYAQQLVFGGGGGFPLQSGFGGMAESNRLAAYEIKSGKLRWEIGGPKGTYQLEQAGSFFLGPPLPLFGRLYVLAEIDGEIRLLALEAATGQLAWSQQIAVGAQEFLANPVQRLTGASPSYADGVLVCPTSAGAIVAIDLASRALLWGVRYARADGWWYGQNRAALIEFNISNSGERQAGAVHWLDSSATVAAGRVILTPPDSDRIHCHDLLTGEMLWEAPRRAGVEDGLFIGCVEEDRVLVVGARRLHALDLKNGQAAWNQDFELPDDASVSGRGFASKGVYYLPTTSGAVLGIDIASGKVVSQARPMAAVGAVGPMPRMPLGNLICHRGSVLAHGADFLECFDQLDALAERTAATLAATPDDPRALIGMGEIHLQRGAFADAVACLRKAWEIRPDEAARGVLTEAYLSVLEQDFAALKDRLGDVESVIRTPAERSAFLRLTAAGLESSGDRVAAFEAYLKLAEVAADCEEGELESIDAHWRVRCERLVRGHLERLFSAADDAQRAEMERRVTQVLDTSVANGGLEELKRFVRYYGGFVVAEPARFKLAAAHAAAGEWLAAELIWRDLEGSPRAEIARAAWAAEARMLVAANRPVDAAVYYARLATEWADETCLDTLTGRQLVEQLPEDHAVRRRLSAANDWPLGDVKAVRGESDDDAFGVPIPVELDGPRGPFFQTTAMELTTPSTQRMVLSARDGCGVPLWRAALADPQQPDMMIMAPSTRATSGQVNGHLVLVNFGFHLFAIDPLGGASPGEAKVLWRADLSENLSGSPQMQAFQPKDATMLFRGTRIVTSQAGRRVGAVACLGEIGLAYQRGRTLCVVSPLDGALQWSRDDVPAGSEVFGDRNLLFVIPPSSQQSEAIIFDAVDGHELGRRPVPEAKDRLLLAGRRVCTWNLLGAEAALQCQDLWTGDTLWDRKLPASAKAWLVDDESLGVFQRPGTFQLIRLSDGTLEIDETVEGMLAQEQTQFEIFVLSDPDRYLLVVTKRSPFTRRRNSSAVTPGIANAINFPYIDGRVMAFDRRTRRAAWLKPAVVEKHCLNLRQAAELPVLVFMSQGPSENGGGRQEGKLLCIDKRTGREAHAATFPLRAAMNSYYVSGDRDKGAVTIGTADNTVVLEFGAGAAPEQQPDAAGDLQASRRDFEPFQGNSGRPAGYD